MSYAPFNQWYPNQQMSIQNVNGMNVNMMISEIWVWQCELLISSRCEVRGKYVWLKSNKMLEWNGHQTSSRLPARQNRTTTSLDWGNTHPVTVTAATPQHLQSEGEEQLRNLFLRQEAHLLVLAKPPTVDDNDTGRNELQWKGHSSYTHFTLPVTSQGESWTTQGQGHARQRTN